MFENNSRLNKFLSYVYVNAAVVFAAVLRFVQFGLTNCFSVSHEWQAYELCSDYSYGFIKRSLLGTLVSFLSCVTGMEFKKAVMVFMNVEELVFSLVLLGILIYVINKYKNPNLNLLILFFLSTDILGFYYSDWGEPDTVLITLSLVMGLLIVREKFVWAVPFIACVCALIHEGFAMMYFGMIVGLLLIQCVRKQGRERLKYFAVLMVTGFMCGCLSAYCYFCTQLVINVTPKQLLADAVGKLGDGINSKMLVANFWNIDPGVHQDGVPTFGFGLRQFALASACIILLPFIIYKVRFWRDLIKNENDKLMKYAYLLCSMVFLFALPLFLTKSDEARWFYAVLLQEVMMIVFLYMMNEDRIKGVLGRFMKASVFNVLIVGMYFIVFSNPNKQFIDLVLVIIPYVMNWGPLL